jgi:hypothetical protein
MRYRKATKHKLTEEMIARNKVINAVFDSRLARNPVQRIGTKGVKANDQKPVQ